MNKNKEIVADIFLLIGLLIVVLWAVVGTNSNEKATAEPTTAYTTEETTEHIIESIPEETTETEPPVVLYDVPLDCELQLHIISTAEAYGIDPAIIVAMAFRESTYNPNAIGDNGNSYGLLQVQPRWHYDRMQRLNCTDLLDPYQNVIVGTDYLAEQIDRYGDLAKGLTAYNRGHYSGTITDYAKTIIAMANELNGI